MVDQHGERSVRQGGGGLTQNLVQNCSVGLWKQTYTCNCLLFTTLKHKETNFLSKKIHMYMFKLSKFSKANHIYPFWFFLVSTWKENLLPCVIRSQPPCQYRLTITKQFFKQRQPYQQTWGTSVCLGVVLWERTQTWWSHPVGQGQDSRSQGLQARPGPGPCWDVPADPPASVSSGPEISHPSPL